MAQMPLLWYICDLEYFPIPLMSSGFLDAILGFFGAIASRFPSASAHPLHAKPSYVVASNAVFTFYWARLSKLNPTMVKLGRLLGRGVGLGLGVVARENAAIFCLDGPDAPLVVHLRPRILPNTPNEFRVPGRGSRLLRRHCFSLSFCFCSPSSCKTLLCSRLKRSGLGSWRGKAPPFFALMAQMPLLWYICDLEYFPIPLMSSGFLDAVLGFFGAIASPFPSASSAFAHPLHAKP
ncbi:hypothetical protein VNO80_08343 [Phaseolus coccineus]|uniref:Uncharacterized protein n=1 Tax=Phaseolus coccineus TaxID=3886 RepID=A0AAN9RG50_PHACN